MENKKIENRKIDIEKAIKDSLFWVKEERLGKFFLAYFLVFLIIFCASLLIGSIAAFFFSFSVGAISFLFLIIWSVAGYFIFNFIKSDGEVLEFFKEYSKYFWIYVVLPGILLIAVALVLILIFAPEYIFDGILFDLARRIARISGGILFDLARITAGIPTQIPILLVLVIPGIIISINASYLSTFYLYSKVGKVFHKKSVFEKFNLANVLELVKFSIVSFVTVLFNWVNKKILIIQVSIIIAIVILATIFLLLKPFAQLSTLLIIFSVILFLFYFVILIYNTLRFYPALLIRIFKNKSATESLKEAWELTRGNALHIFLSTVVVAIVDFAITFVIGIIQLIIQLPFAILSVIYLPQLVRFIQTLLYPLDLLSSSISAFIMMFLQFSIYSQLIRNFIKFPK